MPVDVGREDCVEVVVLVHWLAKVAALLLVPPITVRVSEDTLTGRWVDVATVLEELLSTVTRCDC